MRQGRVISGRGASSFLVAGMLLVGISGVAQTKSATVPDAQVEANVLKALASQPQLADQAISTTTVYGTVTINGSVRDEASRDMAEEIVSKAAGVQKVVDELTIGGDAAASSTEPQGQNSAEMGTNPNLQSDGTMAPTASGQPTQQAQDTGVSNPPEEVENQSPAQPVPYPAPSGPYRRPYSGAYGQQPVPAQPLTSAPAQSLIAQRGGDAVIVPVGSVIRVRMNQAMDSRRTVPGTGFDGVVLNDVVAGGSIAIPRGAAVQGVVEDARRAGQLGGQGGLSLQLTQVTLGGRTYPLVSDYWSHQGVSKTGNTVANTVGLSAMGALIGAVAGGGVGAAVGAGIGGVAGLGVSSASRQGEATIPAEAIVSFRLTQPTELTTVSQAELNRLGAGLPPPGQQGQQAQQLQRRYPPPPPPPPPGYYYPQYRY
ncbi:MAG TPA: BON domain-containing protein [Edaphobacter sp.]|nr:BON domain-containing protein [Edaphobacter sp.]